jgi:hypothetical protein
LAIPIPASGFCVATSAVIGLEVSPVLIIAALNIAAPENRVPEERISELGDMVARAAHRISAALGFRSPAANDIAS